MAENDDKIKVLFLCTGNACRSQIAEGWARHLKADSIVPFSAGICPAGLSSRAVNAMAEAGVDISGQFSKHVNDLTEVDFDYVVTLCNHAKEHCPLFPGTAKMVHRSFIDPVTIPDHNRSMEVLREVRNQIRDFVKSMPESLEEDNL